MQSQSLKLGKAAGPDLISNEMLKCSQEHLIPRLSEIVNICFIKSELMGKYVQSIKLMTHLTLQITGGLLYPV